MKVPPPDLPTTDEKEIAEIQANLSREVDEPTDGAEPVPFWMIVVFGGLLFWGGWYLAVHDGEYKKDVYDRSDAKSEPETFKPPKPPEKKTEKTEKG